MLFKKEVYRKKDLLIIKNEVIWQKIAFKSLFYGE